MSIPVTIVALLFLLMGIVAMGGSLLGMASGRIIAALRERPGRWPLIFFAFESTGAVLVLGTL